MPTLAELKKENEAEEAAAIAAAPKEDEAPLVESETPSEKEEGKEAPEEKKEDADPTSENDTWMKPEEGEPDIVHTGFDAKAIREKWKGRATAAEDKAEALERENAELKAKLKAPVVITGAPEKPKREQFKTDAEFLEAITDHKIKESNQYNQTEAAKADRQRQQEAAQSKTALAVDAHYERAVKLSEKSGIKPEAYQGADLTVRRAIESVFPKAGDSIADSLISSLGTGSEKVFYHLGVNPKKRAELVQLLTEDRSGIRAATFLGRMNAELNTPVKRETAAPDPVDDVKGDKAGAKSGADKLHKEYKSAHDKGDAQAAFNIKKKAKNLKMDVSRW